VLPSVKFWLTLKTYLKGAPFYNAYFFGTDEIGFSVDSNVAGVVNPVRTYSQFSDALTEVLDARIYGGMHYRNSTRIGANMGKQVSRFTTGHYFRPR